MVRKLTSRSSLESLKREAKRWLQALRANDPDARARLATAHPTAPAKPGLRDVQHALAREHGFAGWRALIDELSRRSADEPVASREEAITALLAAADRGDAERVAALLDEHPDIVNERAVLEGHDGRRTALHFAANSMNEALFDVLLARGADPNIRDDGDNAMPIHFAAERGKLAIVRKLIEHGADPIGAGDVHELEVIGWATCFSYAMHVDVAEYLLAHGARHHIFSAVAMGATEAIREIVGRSPGELERTMDRTNHRRHPLHLAVVKRRRDSLATLLALGADTEAEDAAGLTALDQAALGGERPLAGMLIDHGARVSLPAAIALDRRGDVARLLREDPHALRPGGRWERVIIRASETAPAPVIELLIAAGASVHVRDHHATAIDDTHGYTALHAAAFNGNADAVRVLLRHGANPADREDRYWGTPAGWASYAGHAAVRDLILEGAIDIFDAIEFERHQRLARILAEDPQALDRPIAHHVNGIDRPRPWIDKAWTPIAFAAARGKSDAVRMLAERGADLVVTDSRGRTLVEIARASGHEAIARMLEEARALASARVRAEPSFDEHVAGFLRLACLDWRVGGSRRDRSARDAGRLLERHPAIASANVFAAAVCGTIDDVRRMLGERPEAATGIGGPRAWPPLLYLCSARLPGTEWAGHAADVARLLFDRGADPNVFYLGGNADIHYTALTCVLGRGEEVATTHPRARELARLLLERGADPHDEQVMYNVFADNTSRPLLDDDIVWLLELLYEHSVQRGHRARWDDPTWPMFAMHGAPSLGDERIVHHGAHLLIGAAVDRNLPRLAEWVLTHGAGPNVPWGASREERRRRTHYQEAVARGFTEMAELLARHGALREPVTAEPREAFLEACLTMDRDRVRAMAAERPELLRESRTLLAAIRRDRADVVEMLLDLGMSPDAADHASGGARALHVAALSGAERCAALLLARGAEVDPVERRYGGTPLSAAAWARQQRLVELLGRHSRHVWHLTYNGRIDRLREVLRERPELATVVNEDGDTPLMWLPSDEPAALAITRLFLDHGADPARRNARGWSAAELAVRRGMDDVAALLKARGG